MIKLGRLYLRNFKSFYEPVIFDFSNKDLVLFDGPNGFGKTTIFDAIELCFCSDIARIMATDDKVKKTHPLKNKTDEETVICLELINQSDNDTYAIYSVIPESKNKHDNKIASKESKFTVTRKILKKFPEKLIDLEPLTEDEIVTLHAQDKHLDEIINNEHLQDTFNIFNYIQQEETSHFLKQKEANRHQSISYLFGTNDESEDLKKLDNLLKALKDKKSDDLEPRRERIQEDLDFIGKSALDNYEKFEDKELAGSGKISVLQALKGKKELTDEHLNNTKEQLTSIQWVLENNEDYAHLKFNHLLEVILDQRDEQLRHLLYIGHYDNYSAIQENEEKRNKIREFKARKQSFEKIINNHSTIINGNLTVDIIDQYCSLTPHFTKRKEDFSSEIEQLKRLNTEISTFGKILTSISTARENLNKEYQRLLAEEIASEIHCPLCGVKKSSIEQLQLEYEAQSKTFTGLQDDSIKELRDLNHTLKQNLLIPIYKRMQRYISMNESVLLSDHILNKRIVSRDNWEATQKIKEWLNQNKIDYSSSLFTAEATNKDIDSEDERLQQLKETINFKRIPLETEYSYAKIQEHSKALKLTINESVHEILIIDNESENNITTESIKIDLKYLQFLQAKKQYDLIQAKEKERDILDVQIGLIEDKCGQITDIIKTYKSAIRDYERDVASEIAIPFYVYSAKTLQTRLEGSGIFLENRDSGSSIGFIRFVASASDDHDAWNTMSSGQISGLIISFMLAMNKVYPTKLKTLLIDDPVQTMDEINMVSLIQLLRYEFPDYQLIMSTHESNVSDYFEYKYHTFGRRTKAINLKKRRFN